MTSVSPPDGRASRPPRILLCKSGLEEHDRGVRYVMRRLVEAGMEVVYIVFHHPEEVARIAVQEDVDVVGISSSAGGHIAVVRHVREDLKSMGAADVRLVVGGIIPDADHDRLRELGVDGIFGPGSAPEEIDSVVRNAVHQRRAGAA